MTREDRFYVRRLIREELARMLRDIVEISHKDQCIGTSIVERHLEQKAAELDIDRS